MEIDNVGFDRMLVSDNLTSLYYCVKTLIHTQIRKYDSPVGSVSGSITRIPIGFYRQVQSYEIRSD